MAIRTVPSSVTSYAPIIGRQTLICLPQNGNGKSVADLVWESEPEIESVRVTETGRIRVRLFTGEIWEHPFEIQDGSLLLNWIC